MFPHRGQGTIVYDPFRGDMKRHTSNWCVVEVDKEITRYYRWWLKYNRHIHLQPPSWDAHISVVRGEKIRPELSKLWKKYHGKRVEFTYAHVGDYQFGPDVDQGGFFYMVDVQCDLLNTIRSELGLRTGWHFHLTFGRTYEYEARKPKR